ncbi:hypothetical protein MXB_842, partial [Myxobolus squamalis]
MPRCCIVDFEIRLLNSVKHQFTESIIAGCYFHFQQALLRKMKKFQIPKLVCEECSKNIYIFTIVSINEINIAININERDLQGRTNNCLERYNRHLNELFANAHRNLVTFIAAIKNDEEYYSNIMRSIRLGSMELPKKKKEFTKQTLP